jgi:hypothetical protein
MRDGKLTPARLKPAARPSAGVLVYPAAA